jgi:DNA polymerase III subunit delta
MKTTKKKKNIGVTFDEFRNAIRKGDILPVYLFAGTEQFIADEAVELLLDALIPGDQRSFNFDLLYGTDAQSYEVLTVASAFPMIGEKRMVVVREFDKLSKPDLLSEYIKNPLESTVLILISESPDNRRNPFRLFDDPNTLRCWPLYDNQIPSWIINRVRAIKKSISTDAASTLAGYVGTSLYQLANEIDKLDIYTMDRKNITVDDVNHVVGVSKTFNIFELQKAIGQKDAKTAIYILDRMLERGEPPVLIISMLTRFFIGLIKLADMSERRISRDQIARELNTGVYFLKDQYEYLRHHPIERMQKRFRALVEADAALKTSQADSGQILAVLLSKLMNIQNEEESTLEYDSIFANE